jgi:hypothetical protein
MKHPSYRDPFDPSPKWVKRKSTSPQAPEDNWGHIRGTANKVTKLTSSQSAASPS